MEFQAWPKIPRLHRDMIITEKIDGTNACIVIEPVDAGAPMDEQETARVKLVQGDEPIAVELAIFCQSRKRIITPGKNTDNAGFATWVAEHAEELATLAPGRHYGEWWGKGVQRGYGLDKKVFSLFNVHRWRDAERRPDCCSVVPVLDIYTFDHNRIKTVLNTLRESGSVAAAEQGVTGTAAEGIVVYHTAGKHYFKVTLEGDEAPKGAQ